MKRAASTPAQALGAAITMARKQAGLSQTQLGSLIGFDQGNVSRIESGAQQVAAGTLFEIAAALGTPLHLLIEEAEKRTGDLLSKEAIRVARKWQNAPPTNVRRILLSWGQTSQTTLILVARPPRTKRR